MSNDISTLDTQIAQAEQAKRDAAKKVRALKKARTKMLEEHYAATAK